MTVTTETAGTELDVQVAPGLIARVQDADKQFSVADLADLLVSPDRVFPADGKLPKAPGKITVSDKLKASLKRLPQVFAKVQPTEARVLEADEIARLTEEIITIDSAATELGKRKDAIQEIIRNHMDKVAERDGDTKGKSRIADGKAQGHYLLGTPGQPYTVEVDGYEDAWQQRYVKGGSTPSLAELIKLADEGKITRAEFLGFTKAVRVLDENKAAEFIRKGPGRGLQILAAITKKGAPSASLYAPKK